MAERKGRKRRGPDLAQPHGELKIPQRQPLTKLALSLLKIQRSLCETLPNTHLKEKQSEEDELSHYLVNGVTVRQDTWQ